MKSSKYQINIIILWLLTLIIIIVGSFNTISSPPSEYYINPIMRFIAYAFLSFLIPLIIRNIYILIFSLVGIITIIVGIEVLQSYTPIRMGSFEDFIVATFSAMFGMVVGYLYNKKKFSETKI